jgi:hypothetical protein
LEFCSLGQLNVWQSLTADMHWLAQDLVGGLMAAMCVGKLAELDSAVVFKVVSFWGTTYTVTPLCRD